MKDPEQFRLRDIPCYILGPLYGLIGAADDMGGIIGFALGALSMVVFALWVLA